MDRRFVIFILAAVIILYLFYGTNRNRKQVVPPPPATMTTNQNVEQAETSQIQQKAINIPEKTLPSPEKIKKANIQNNRVQWTTSSWGAKVENIKILDFGQTETPIEIIDDSAKSRYLAMNVFMLQKEFDLEHINWESKTIGNSIEFQTEPLDGIKIIKTMKLDDSLYSGTLEIKVENNSKTPLSIEKINVFLGPGLRKSNDKFAVKQAAAMIGRKVERLNDQKGFFNKILSKEKEQRIDLSQNIEWLALRDQYFCIMAYPDTGFLPAGRIERNQNEEISAEINFAGASLAPGEVKQYDLKIYAGPQNYQELRKYSKKLHAIVDFGMFGVISVPIYYTLKYFYKLTKNYGVAIILLTVLMRAVLWWPTQKSQTSMKKMQTAMSKMQPRLKTLKEIYKDNPAKLNEETMKLYKEYQVNPMGGCLPMLLQLPIFFALYSALIAAVELKGAEFVWVWKDLSLKDPSYILPLAMGLSMFVQQKMSTPPAATHEAATQQKMMLYLMPVMLTFFAFMWPSGLLLYWVISNILSITQQIVINRQK